MSLSRNSQMKKKKEKFPYRFRAFLSLSFLPPSQNNGGEWSVIFGAQSIEKIHLNNFNQRRLFPENKSTGCSGSSTKHFVNSFQLVS